MAGVGIRKRLLLLLRLRLVGVVYKLLKVGFLDFIIQSNCTPIIVIVILIIVVTSAIMLVNRKRSVRCGCRLVRCLGRFFREVFLLLLRIVLDPLLDGLLKSRAVGLVLFGNSALNGIVNVGLNQ